MSNTRDLKEQIVKVPFGLSREVIQQKIIPLAADTKDDNHIKATREMAKLSITCKPFHAFFQPEVDKRKLLIAVLLGYEKEAVFIAKRNPELFFIKATANDYAMDLEGNCRTIEDWSPYQAMFGTMDGKMLQETMPFLDIYLNTITNGQALARKQREEKFPNGLNYPPSEYDFMPLIQIIDNDHSLIESGKPSSDTLKALDKFRLDFKPDNVKIGHHFNMNHFIKIHHIYDNIWQKWSRNQYQHLFFEKFVFGFFNRLLTAPYLQRACQGICTNEYPQLQRGFEIMNNSTGQINSVVPFDKDPHSRLGENCFIIPYISLTGPSLSYNYCMGWGPGGGDLGSGTRSWEMILREDYNLINKNFNPNIQNILSIKMSL